MSDTLYQQLTTAKSRHGRCTDWIRENRRRRSAGLPQKRVLPFGMGIFDPVNRTVATTLRDGTVEIKHLPKGSRR
jgi:hypothetical protein